MNIHISYDEEYPVFFLATDFDHFNKKSVTISDEKLEKWKKIESEYKEMQMEMRELYGNI
jgi:hypothetical protein